MAPGAGAPGSTSRLLALAALLSRFVLTAALLTTLVAATLLLAGLRLLLVRLLLTTLIGIVCLVHALLLLLHTNQRRVATECSRHEIMPLSASGYVI
jgi:hypothetical protein